jgi:hypothetical protein
VEYQAQTPPDIGVGNRTAVKGDGGNALRTPRPSGRTRRASRLRNRVDPQSAFFVYRAKAQFRLTSRETRHPDTGRSPASSAQVVVSHILSHTACLRSSMSEGNETVVV